ncbi:Ig-like domain-containing protein [Hahella ganghwensis]|uniref:Ig-like domain-containing protein n=1 Tax=Hahella ganghwensis TaxID=286420 RepID=UPI000376A718|nr:Ig-like domain-containing protein [Hahella ganghwensis]
MISIRRWLWIVGFLGLLLGGKALAEESLCAVVKIEISQELTLERQAFEATMRITNSLDSFALENIKIDILFKDADGNPVVATSDPDAESASFFIKLDQHQGINSVTEGAFGKVTDGKIDPTQVGELRWLIIPTKGAGGDGTQGKLYYVGATINLTYGGETQTIEVAPDTIVVKPQPNLVLDYFLTKEVNGDNPFTTEQEPVEPYTLGVRISNNGSGTAGSVKIDSAQPKIVENKNDLLVDFLITGSYVDDQPAAKTLLLNFGDIEGQTNRVGRWIMETSLTGRFTEFSAQFSHADELGGALTSLIESVNTHLLISDVLVDLSGRDTKRDFLAHDGDGNLKVYESDRLGTTVAGCSDCTSVSSLSGTLGAEQITGSLIKRSLTATATTGLSHIKISDPYAGDKPLTSVVRNDGKVLPVTNYWLSKTIQENKIDYDYFVNVFDSNTTGQYTLQFGGVSNVNVAPSIQPIADRSTYESGQVGFLVRASDPNGTVPVLTALNLPSGATFTNKGNGDATFNWFPASGQAGTYSLSFEASDGQLKATRAVTVKVYPESDKDGDGMDDAWEEEQFGNLDRDGSDDFDGDGISDLEEFLDGTDPLNPPEGPQSPELNTPIFDGEVTSLVPTLSVTNGAHQDGTYTYHFEVYSDESMSVKVAEIVDVAEGSTTTQAEMNAETLQSGQSFSDNTTYYWRARLEGTEANSDWVNGRFFINTANDAPTNFAVAAPGNGTLVASYKPTLIVNNGSDIDGDPLTYSFYVYAEEDTSFSSPVAQVEGLAPGLNGQTSWQVPVLLEENKLYFWIAEVVDDEGARASSEASSFVVSTANEAPSNPVILSPADHAELSSTSVVLKIQNAVDPERKALTYIFELDTVNTFDGANKLSQTDVVAGNDNQTSVQFDGLVDNAQYFWRVKASDGETESVWVMADFTISTTQEAPPTPTLDIPGDNVWVEVGAPTLGVHAVVDPDGDTVSYRFQVFSDSDLTNLLIDHVSTTAQWTLDVELDDNTYFWWRASAVDEAGLASGWSEAQKFFVNIDGLDDAPAINFVLPAQDQTVLGGDVLIQWTDTDPDSAATITLFANGLPIATDIAEDADGTADQFLWNTDALVDGEYTLSARIEDAVNVIDVVATAKITKQSPTAGVVVTPLTTLDINETGNQVAEVEVVLSQAPVDAAGGQGSVLINLAISDAEEGEILSSSYLQFSDTNWNIPQVIKVAGVDDCLVDGTQAVNLQFAGVVSNDPQYDGLGIADVELSNLDDEVSGQALVICRYDATINSTLNGVANVTLKPYLKNDGVTLLSASAVAQARAGESIQFVDTNQASFPTIIKGTDTLSSNALIIELPEDDAVKGDYRGIVWAITPGDAASQSNGDNGDNIIQGSDEADVIDGQDGDDIIHGGDGDDDITGGEGSDQLYGGLGDDVFRAEGYLTYPDLYFGGEGYDTLQGGSGDDIIRITTFGTEVDGNLVSVEKIDGGAGYNQIVALHSSDYLDFSNTTLVNISRIMAHRGNDTVIGSAGNDIIEGGEGIDTLRGGPGDDVFLMEGQGIYGDDINGGGGYDQVWGGEGDDVIRFVHLEQVEVIDGRGGYDLLVVLPKAILSI